MTEKTKPLSKKQDAFVKAYLLNGGNGTRAAIDAGYSESTAKQMGSENLTKPAIKAAIQKHQKKADSVFIWSKEKKLEMLQDTAKKSLRQIYDAQGNERLENPQAAISAIKEHNVMQGDNAPIESNITHKFAKLDEDTLDARIKHLESEMNNYSK